MYECICMYIYLSIFLSLSLYIYIYIYKGEGLLRGVGTLRYLFPPSACLQWQRDGLTIQKKKQFLGAGFLGAPPISLSTAVRQVSTIHGGAAIQLDASSTPIHQTGCAVLYCTATYCIEAREFVLVMYCTPRLCCPAMY